MIRSFVLCAVALCIAACASPQQRIATSLIDAGVPEAPARCVAGEVSERLTTGQLRDLAAAVKAVRGAETTPVTERNIGRLVEQVARAVDPQIASVVGRAGLACVILGR
jgi:hypothetical protein